LERPSCDGQGEAPGAGGRGRAGRLRWPAGEVASGSVVDAGVRLWRVEAPGWGGRWGAEMATGAERTAISAIKVCPNICFN